MGKRNIKSLAVREEIVTSGTEFSITPERKSELLGHATKSGVALKTSTVKNGLKYPIRFETKGTSILTRAAYALATKAGQNEVDAPTFGAAMESLVKDSALLSRVPFPPEYKNLKTAYSRIRKEIKDAAVIAFTIDGTEAQAKDIASFRKLLA